MSPLSRDASIAVLGGGVSGLTFAATMRELGHSNVVVFEREARAGGKCHTAIIDGRAHDLGATMGVPLDYRQIQRFSDAAGIATDRFPKERHYSLATGREASLNRWREIPRVLAQSARYLAMHTQRWMGADGTGLHRAPTDLHQTWSELVDQHGLHALSQRMLAYRTGYGYGWDDTVPAVMFANLIRPQTVLGLATGHSMMWRGGTQGIWESLARGLDVRTSTRVESIARGDGGVVVRSSRGEQRFDAIVITLDPRDALRVLDASDEERGWFSQVQSYPYATFACEVRGLTKGASVGYLDENMVKERAGHPMAWMRRYDADDIYVFHLFAPTDVDDETVAARIAHDVEKLGGRFVAVRASKRWSFFPHFSSAFMKAGGLSAVEAWQGKTRAYLIGEVLSFSSMARTAELATACAQRMVSEGLADLQQRARAAS